MCHFFTGRGCRLDNHQIPRESEYSAPSSSHNRPDEWNERTLAFYPGVCTKIRNNVSQVNILGWGIFCQFSLVRKKRSFQKFFFFKVLHKFV